MLGKLFKHEWKSVYKINTILVGAVALITLLGCIGIRITWEAKIFENDALFEQEPLFAFITAMSMVASFILYILTLMGAVYGVLIYSSVHFYKTMYTDEGYLTHTLPVKPHQILISKTLVSGIWYFLVTLAVMASIFTLILTIGGIVIENVPGMSWADFWSGMGEVFSEMQEMMGGQLIHFVSILILIILVAPFSSIIMLFGALTIGQTSKKYKILMSILSYIGISTISGFITFIGQIIVMFFYGMSSDEVSSGYMMAQYDVSLLQAVIMGAALYFISHHIISKNLNLE